MLHNKKVSLARILLVKFMTIGRHISGLMASMVEIDVQYLSNCLVILNTLSELLFVPTNRQLQPFLYEKSAFTFPQKTWTPC